MSEGKFQNMTPHVPNKKAGDTTAIDESTDTYDTVDWLVKNLPNNNGKVGLWGISIPRVLCRRRDDRPSSKFGRGLATGTDCRLVL